MRIAIYGGSFNPPHLGHIEAARAVESRIKPDKLLIIPASIPPHKQLAVGSASAEERLELCKLAFAEIPKAEVCDLELKREGKSYTSDTVSELSTLYPNSELYLAMGTDMLLSFETWHEFKCLLDRLTLAVFCRSAGEDAELNAHAEKLRWEYGAEIVFIPHEPLPMSSTEIRELLPKRAGRDKLSDSVYSRIIAKGDFGAKPDLDWLREKSQTYLKPKRVPHVLGCEKEAVSLARHYGADEIIAAEAGILHDITKKLLLNEQLILCEKYGIINDAFETENLKLLHAKTGAALARELFNISDEVYEAIRWHTTGKPNMSLMEKIIYMADYIEPNRDFEGVEELRRLSYENLDAAMALGLRMSLEDIRSNGAEPYYITLEAYEWYRDIEDN